MQLKKKNRYDRCVVCIAAMIWVFGLLAAGSDSVYMPWLNVVGAIVFLFVSLWLGRVLPRLEESKNNVQPSRQFKTKKQTNFHVKKQNRQVNTSYAGGWSPV